MRYYASFASGGGGNSCFVNTGQIGKNGVSMHLSSNRHQIQFELESLKCLNMNKQKKVNIPTVRVCCLFSLQSFYTCTVEGCIILAQKSPGGGSYCRWTLRSGGLQSLKGGQLFRLSTNSFNRKLILFFLLLRCNQPTLTEVDYFSYKKKKCLAIKCNQTLRMLKFYCDVYNIYKLCYLSDWYTLKAYGAY